MAMNKKEKAEVEALKKKLYMARALSWPRNPPKPYTFGELDAAMPKTSSGLNRADKHRELVIGWQYNAYNQRISEVAYNGFYICTSYSSERPFKELSWSQTGNYGHKNDHHSTIYRTRKDAIEAMVHELLMKTASDCARWLEQMEDPLVEAYAGDR